MSEMLFHISRNIYLSGNAAPIADRPGPDRRLMMLKVGDLPRCQRCSLGDSTPPIPSLSINIVRINSLVDRFRQRSAWDIVESYRHVALLFRLILTLRPIDWALQLYFNLTC